VLIKGTIATMLRPFKNPTENMSAVDTMACSLYSRQIREIILNSIPMFQDHIDGERLEKHCFLFQ
jgi:hypothetical protein